MKKLSLNLTWLLLMCSVLYAQNQPDFHWMSKTGTSRIMEDSEINTLAFYQWGKERLCEEFFLKLREDLVAEALSSDSIMVTLKQPATDTLNQIMVSPTRDTTNYHQFGRLYDGIKFYRYNAHKFFIMFDISQYTGADNYCLERDVDKSLSLVLKIDQPEE